jgi:phosphomannomutase
VIGGEGNGGVIYPTFHAGRDSLIAAALVLSCLATEKLTLSELVATFTEYFTIKSKAALPDDFPGKLEQFEAKAVEILGKTKVDRKDGLRFDFAEGWLQLRSSNTEPIYRLIVETRSRKLSNDLYETVRKHFR